MGIRNPNRKLYFEISGEVVAPDGGSDAAYSLCQTMTAEEFLAELALMLREPVLEMLSSNGEGVGDVLMIRVRDSADPLQEGG